LIWCLVPTTAQKENGRKPMVWQTIKSKAVICITLCCHSERPNNHAAGLIGVRSKCFPVNKRFRGNVSIQQFPTKNSSLVLPQYRYEVCFRPGADFEPSGVITPPLKFMLTVALDSDPGASCSLFEQLQLSIALMQIHGHSQSRFGARRMSGSPLPTCKLLNTLILSRFDRSLFRTAGAHQPEWLFAANRASRDGRSTKAQEQTP
jgi:hypothetical protein